MKVQFTVVAAAVLMALIAFAPSVEAVKRDIGFEAELAGANEVPPVETEAEGKADFQVDEEQTFIEYELEVEAPEDANILGAAGAHIHCGQPGENGPVVVFLSGVIPGGVGTELKIEGFLTQANIINDACGATLPELVQAMRDGMTYVNVHSADFPGGEIRGQIAEE